MERSFKSLLKRGNKKIGKDTFIFNMGSYTNCPSRKLGLCKLNEACYARQPELQYKDICINYRTTQEKLWINISANEFSDKLKAILKRLRKPIKFFRFNESGDFHSRECVSKVKDIARKNPSISFYTYTHRKDLNLKSTPKNLNILTSNFKRKGMSAFKVVKKIDKSKPYCKKNCRICSLCKIKRTKPITIQTLKG